MHNLSKNELSKVFGGTRIVEFAEDTGDHFITVAGYASPGAAARQVLYDCCAGASAGIFSAFVWGEFKVFSTPAVVMYAGQGVIWTVMTTLVDIALRENKDLLPTMFGPANAAASTYSVKYTTQRES